MTTGSPTAPPAPGARDLQFYYFGFYNALIRHRLMTIFGWVVVLAGCAGLPLAWNNRSLHPLIDAGFAAMLIVAGIALVQLSISSLEAYIRVPFAPERPPGQEEHPAVPEMRALMEDVASGGWHEVLRAIAGLNTLQTTYGLPPLTGTGRSVYI